MKRLIVIFTLCCMLSAGAFAVLLAADRQLGMPLPYSIPLSFTVATIIAPILFALANAIRLRRPVIIQAAATPASRPQHAGDTSPVRRPAEGVVLLDVSTARKLREQAA